VRLATRAIEEAGTVVRRASKVGGRDAGPRRPNLAAGTASGSVVGVKEDDVTERTRWTIHEERLLDENPHVRISLADVELPDGTLFTQYVFRMRRCVMSAVLDESGERILLMWRHRFIIDKWVWEIPGGYVDDDEDGAAAAAREVEEETGWRPRNVTFMVSYQPMIGNADSPQDLYIARGADRAGDPGSDEAAAVRWVPIDEAAAMITSGEIVGAATIIAVQQALMIRAGAALPAR
jgi:8-oxo-dGTP pyrophosphatase MutT (NUDIX family)